MGPELEVGFGEAWLFIFRAFKQPNAAILIPNSDKRIRYRFVISSNGKESTDPKLTITTRNRKRDCVVCLRSYIHANVCIIRLSEEVSGLILPFFRPCKLMFERPSFCDCAIGTDLLPKISSLWTSVLRTYNRLSNVHYFPVQPAMRW